jgi:hypothetical protein
MLILNTYRYPNGTEALTSQGAWLHHTVLGNTAMGVIWLVKKSPFDGQNKAEQSLGPRAMKDRLLG